MVHKKPVFYHAPQDDAAFDAWLRPILDLAHGAILHEAVPERLLRALRRSGPG